MNQVTSSTVAQPAQAEAIDLCLRTCWSLKVFHSGTLLPSASVTSITGGAGLRVRICASCSADGLPVTRQEDRKGAAGVSPETFSDHIAKAASKLPGSQSGFEEFGGISS